MRAKCRGWRRPRTSGPSTSRAGRSCSSLVRAGTARARRFPEHAPPDHRCVVARRFRSRGPSTVRGVHGWPPLAALAAAHSMRGHSHVGSAGSGLGRRLRRQLDYWQSRLRTRPTTLTLPLDRPRPPHASFCGAQIMRRLPRPAHCEPSTAVRQRECDAFSVQSDGVQGRSAPL